MQEARTGRPNTHHPASRPLPERRWDRLTLEEQIVLNIAGALYRDLLWKHRAAVEYLRERGLPDWTIRACGLGYSDGHSLEACLRQRSLVRVAEALGLLRRPEPGATGRPLREFFARRIVVPELRGGQPIWFWGRAWNRAMPVLAQDRSWVRRRLGALARLGLLRSVTHDELKELRAPYENEARLAELTLSGLSTLATLLGLPTGAAVCSLGLSGGGAEAPTGARNELWRHLAHTLGVDRAFGALARLARAHARGGELIEWRNAAASAHGRLRPDGYGVLRIGRKLYGFFLEYDRGTMRPTRLRAKFAAYQGYRASSLAARVYGGFPTILVVAATSGAQARLVRAARALSPGFGGPLPVLFTTEALLATCPDQPIWRTFSERLSRLVWPV
jgi:hypothetical protein